VENENLKAKGRLMTIPEMANEYKRFVLRAYQRGYRWRSYERLKGDRKANDEMDLLYCVDKDKEEEVYKVIRKEGGASLKA